jgi:hypothetical protein
MIYRKKRQEKKAKGNNHKEKKIYNMGHVRPGSSREG